MNIISKLIEAHIYRNINGIEFLLLQRSPKQIYPNIWQMVTGKIKEGEKAYQTAIREVYEETSISANNIWVVPHVNQFYDWKEDYVCLVPVFLIESDKDAIVRLSDEHVNYKWVSYDEAINLLAWPGQKKSLEIINDYLTKDNNFLQFNKIILK
ncbi:MAG: NUDIX pyrophosphatase [Ignavibacteria bacterium]|nr:NUDIX pyrophosphatase [Ignavibacteria bacterium]